MAVTSRNIKGSKIVDNLDRGDAKVVNSIKGGVKRAYSTEVSPGNKKQTDVKSGVVQGGYRSK